METDIREISPDQFEASAKVIRESFQTVADDFGFTAENNPTNGAFIQSERLTKEGLYEHNIF